MMKLFSPHSDWRDRKWTYEKIGYRRSWHGPYRRRRWCRRRYSMEVYKMAFSVLAFLGALFLGAIFVMLLGEWIVN